MDEIKAFIDRIVVSRERRQKTADEQYVYWKQVLLRRFGSVLSGAKAYEQAMKLLCDRLYY